MEEKDEIIDRLVKFAKEYAELVPFGAAICGIDRREVHLSESLYREFFPDYHEHKMVPVNANIRVQCLYNGVTFFALFTPRIKGEPKDLI